MPEPTATPTSGVKTSGPTPVTTALAPTPIVAAVEPTAAPISEPSKPTVTAVPAPQPAAVPIASQPESTAAPLALPTPGPEHTEKAHVELQNTLTERFTDAEWKALKEFRKVLPDAVAASQEGKPKTEVAPFTLWGVPIDPAHPEKDARVSVVLMKFLRARHLSVSAASSMLTATLRWRETFDVAGAIKAEYPADVYAGVGQVYGKDKEGRPVIYNLYGANPDQEAVFGDVQRFLRWRVKLMEASLELLDFETVDQTVQIHDYQGASFTNRHPAAKKAATEATSVFSDHYPELLYRKYFINVPRLLNWIFWLFKSMLSAETIAKMTVVGSGKSSIASALLPVISQEELPKRYGGEAEGF